MYERGKTKNNRMHTVITICDLRLRPTSILSQIFVSLCGTGSSSLLLKYIQKNGYIKLLICPRKYVKVQATSQKINTVITWQALNNLAMDANCFFQSKLIHDSLYLFKWQIQKKIYTKITWMVEMWWLVLFLMYKLMKGPCAWCGFILISGDGLMFNAI